MKCAKNAEYPGKREKKVEQLRKTEKKPNNTENVKNERAIGRAHFAFRGWGGSDGTRRRAGVHRKEAAFGRAESTVYTEVLMFRRRDLIIVAGMEGWVRA